MENYIRLLVKWGYRFFRWSGTAYVQSWILFHKGNSTPFYNDARIHELISIRSKSLTNPRLFEYKAPANKREVETLLKEIRETKDDIKYLRELGRMTWLDYRLQDATKKEILDYLIVCFKERDFWECAMDVGIRGINLVMLYHHLNDRLTLIEKERYAGMIKKCLRYVLFNIEYSYIKTNHLATNLSSLLVMSSFLGYKRIEMFSELALSRVIGSMTKDGVFYERSSGYTNIMLENSIIYSLYENKKNKYFASIFPIAIRSSSFSIDYIFESNYDHLRAQEILFNYGDNDSGRIFCMSSLDYSRDDIIYFFQKNKYKSSSMTSNILEVRGFRCALICTDTGQVKKGGHGHNDKGMFVLSLNGFPYIVDNGCSVYTGDQRLRNFYRSTKSHSTLYFDCEQNSLSKGMFVLPETSKFVTFKKYKSSLLGIYDTGSYLHERNITIIDNEGLLISDVFVSETVPKFVLNLHPDVSYAHDKSILVLSHSKSHDKIALEFSDNIRISEEESFYSYGYGNISQSKRLMIQVRDVSNVISVKINVA